MQRNTKSICITTGQRNLIHSTILTSSYNSVSIQLLKISVNFTTDARKNTWRLIAYKYKSRYDRLLCLLAFDILIVREKGKYYGLRTNDFTRTI